MHNTWLICRLQLEGVFRLRVRRTGAVMTMALYALAGLLMMAYSGGIAWALNEVGMGQLALVLMLVAASLVALVTTVMRCGSGLLACRDYDFIASLPLGAAQHVGGRLLALYLSELAFFAALLLPAGVICAWGRGAQAWAAVLFTLPLAPLIPLALGTVLGAGVLVISARSRHARLWAILLGLAGTLGVMALSMSMPMMGESQLYQLGLMAQDAITRFYPPARALTGALTGDFRGFFIFALFSAALSALAVGLLARHYGAVQARLAARYRSEDFRVNAMRRRTPLLAMWTREMKRMFSLPVYALNVLVGPILYVVAGVAGLSIGAGKLTQALAAMQMQAYILPAVPLLGAMMVCLVPASNCAESLEGKSRWILLAAPVSRGAYRSAKLLSSLAVQLPGALAGGLIVALALNAASDWAALFMLMPAAWALLSSVCGLAINLKWPRYDWVNEQQVVKQGLPVLLSMLFDMLTIVGAGALAILYPGQALAVLWTLTGLAALLGGLWWTWLCRE